MYLKFILGFLFRVLRIKFLLLAWFVMFRALSFVRSISIYVVYRFDREAEAVIEREKPSVRQF